MVDFAKQLAKERAMTKEERMATKVQSIVKWDQELARIAEQAAKQEANTGGGQFFSLRGGTLKLNDAPIPNNEMAVVIVDGVIENVYYEGDFDPDSPQAPACYAFGRSDETIAPHEEAEHKQSANCADCQHNQWGSSSKGRGKACRNRRRLALISAGEFDKAGNFTMTAGGKELTTDDFASAQVCYLAVPPTSIQGYGAYVKQLYGVFKRPPFGVITKIKVQPDQKTQLKVTFECVKPLDNDLLLAVMQKHEEQAGNDPGQAGPIGFAYPKREAAPAKKPAYRAPNRPRKY